MRPERRPYRARPAWLFLCVLACTSCEPPAEEVSDDTYVPDCGVEEEPEDLTYACPSGVYECPWD